MADPEITARIWYTRRDRGAADCIAKVFRARRLAAEALRDYVASGSNPASRVRLRRLRNEAVAPVLRALGPLPPFDWAAATREAKRVALRLGKQARSHAEKRVAIELREVVLPLFSVYRDPRRFFRVVAPRRFPADFDRGRLFDPKGPWLALTIQRWGIAAFLNPAVARAFALPSTNITRILTLSKERPFEKPVGRPRGRLSKARGSIIDWGARKRYFTAAAAVLNADSRLSVARQEAMVSVLGEKLIAELTATREAKFPSARVARQVAYRRTAAKFKTTVSALKKGFERH
jgi:hypothetical protein